MKSLLFTAILSLRKRLEQILIKFAILLQVKLTHAQTFFRGVGSTWFINLFSIYACSLVRFGTGEVENGIGKRPLNARSEKRAL
jgi:hypothetical protein